MNKDIIINNIVNNINKNGYYILKNYYDKTLCENIYKDIKNNTSQYIYTKGEGNDLRFSNYRTEYSYNFLNNKLFMEVGSKIVGNKIKDNHKRCQVGILNSNNSKSCSGGGWHVDNLEPQFKAILYLTDVNENNGAFAILDPPIKMEDIDDKLKFNNTRIINQPDCKEFTEKYKKNIKLLTGEMGDVILVNTNYLHRGTIIIEGERITLTNYYY